MYFNVLCICGRFTKRGLLSKHTLDINSLFDLVPFFAETRVSPVIHAAVYSGSNERQADGAGRDIRRGVSKVQRLVCGLLPVT